MPRPKFGLYTVRDKSVYLDELTKIMFSKTENLGPKTRIKNVNINSMASSGLHSQCPMSLTAVRGTKVLGSDELFISERFRTNLTID